MAAMLNTFNWERTEEITLSGVVIKYGLADDWSLNPGDAVIASLCQHDEELHELMPLHARMSSLAVHLCSILADRTLNAFDRPHPAGEDEFTFVEGWYWNSAPLVVLLRQLGSEDPTTNFVWDVKVPAKVMLRNQMQDVKAMNHEVGIARRHELDPRRMPGGEKLTDYEYGVALKRGHTLAREVPSYATAVSDSTEQLVATSAAPSVLAVPEGGGRVVSFVSRPTDNMRLALQTQVERLEGAPQEANTEDDSIADLNAKFGFAQALEPDADASAPEVPLRVVRCGAQPPAGFVSHGATEHYRDAQNHSTLPISANVLPEGAVCPHGVVRPVDNADLERRVSQVVADYTGADLPTVPGDRVLVAEGIDAPADDQLSSPGGAIQALLLQPCYPQEVPEGSTDYPEGCIDGGAPSPPPRILCPPTIGPTSPTLPRFIAHLWARGIL